jgi:hypothetical protein
MAARREREMYSAFFEYARARVATGGGPGPGADSANVGEAAPRFDRASVLREALSYFGCADAFDALTAANAHAHALRTVFTSADVRAWTGLRASEDWRVVKALMDAVRRELGGEEGMLRVGTEAVRECVVRLRPGVEKELRDEWERICRERERQTKAEGWEVAVEDGNRGDGDGVCNEGWCLFWWAHFATHR